MELLNLRHSAPLSPAAILAHLRQHPKANSVKTQKASVYSSEQPGSSPEPTQGTTVQQNNDQMSMDPSPLMEESVNHEEQDQGIVNTIKLPGGILKDPKKSIILRIRDKSSSPPSLDRKALDDRLTLLKVDTTQQCTEKNSFRVTKRSNVTTLPCSLDGSRPSSRGNNVSIGNIYISPKNKKNKKVTFSVGTKDLGVFNDPITIKKSHIPPFEDLLKDENVNIVPLENLSSISKPPSRSSPRTPITRTSERKQQGSFFNINIKHRVFKDSDSQKTFLNTELISEFRDSTPSGRSCTPRKTEVPPPLKLNQGPSNVSKLVEDFSPFATSTGGCLSARSSFNINISNTTNTKNALMTERTTPRSSHASPGKLNEATLNFYSNLQQQKKRLVAVNSPCRSSAQPDGRVSEFIITKKDTRRSLFTSPERLSILNALKKREVKPYP